MALERIFIDASVVFDVAFWRNKADRAAICLANPAADFVISPITIHLLYYFCERDNYATKQVQAFLDEFEVAPLTQAMVRVAQNRYPGRDFEDCLQAACAEAAGCDKIVTADTNFERDSGTRLPVIVL